MAQRPRLRRRGLGIALAMFAAAACGADTGSDREKELEQLRGRIGELQSDLDSARGKHKDLEQELRSAEIRIGTVSRRLRELDQELAAQQRRLEELEQDRGRQQGELALHRQALIAQIRAAYAMGRQERLKIMLNQQDPAVVSRVMVYYDYFNRARSEKLTLISALIEQLRETEAQTLAGQARLRELQARELEQKRQLERANTDRQLALKGIQQEIQSKGQALEGLKKDEQRLQELITRLQREAQLSTAESQKQTTPFNKRKGAMTWPVAGRLAASFGQERGGGLRWDGVFIAATEGGEVQAIHHGRVVFADWLRGFGLLLIIDHGSGYMSLYGHNRSLFKEVGEWVVQGEAVAQVGNSGGQLQAGVYFGIRHKGKPVNPTAWCKAKPGPKLGARWPRPTGPASKVGSEPALGAAESKA